MSRVNSNNNVTETPVFGTVPSNENVTERGGTPPFSSLGQPVVCGLPSVWHHCGMCQSSPDSHGQRLGSRHWLLSGGGLRAGSRVLGRVNGSLRSAFGRR